MGAVALIICSVGVRFAICKRRTIWQTISRISDCVYKHLMRPPDITPSRVSGNYDGMEGTFRGMLAFWNKSNNELVIKTTRGAELSTVSAFQWMGCPLAQNTYILYHCIGITWSYLNLSMNYISSGRITVQLFLSPSVKALGIQIASEQ